MYIKTKRAFKKAKRKYLQRVIQRAYETIWDKEIRKNAILQIREGIRREYDKLEGRIKGAEDALVKFEEELEKVREDLRNSHGIERQKNEEKERELDKKIATAKEMRDKRKSDAETKKNQMIGKWSEKTQQYEAGIDQEVDAIKSKIEAGFLFIQEVKKQYDEV